MRQSETKIEFSKCKKCSKALHISLLQANPNGAGKICIDTDSCAKKNSE